MNTNSNIFLAYTALIIMVILIIVFLLVYIIRRFGKVLHGLYNLELESRQAIIGIHYASVTDEHLLSGKL